MSKMNETSEESKQEAEKIYNIDSIKHFHQNIEKVVIYVNQKKNVPDSLPSSEAQLNGFITDSSENRYLLSDYGPNDRIDPPPAALYILNLYFFTIAVGTNEEFLVLEQFSVDGINEWSCPYTLHSLRLESSPSSLGEIRHLFSAEFESSADKLNEDENKLFSEMGILFKQLEIGRDYIEYVKDANTATCFFVREYFVHNIDVCAIGKEVASGRFRYYPLSLFAEHDDMFHGIDDINSVGLWYGINNIPITPNCYYPIFQAWACKNIFLGQRIPERILGAPMERLKSNSIPVPKSAFMDDHGLLFMVTVTSELEISWEKAFEKTCSKYGFKYYAFYTDNMISAIPDGEGELFPRLLSFAEDLFQEIGIDGEPFLLLISSLVCDFSYGRIDGYSTRRVGFYSSGLERLLATHAALSEKTDEMRKDPKSKLTLDCGIISATDAYEFTDRFRRTYHPISSMVYGNGWHATVSYQRKQGKETAWKKIRKML